MSDSSLEIRVLVITMGGARREAVEKMFDEIGGFAKPVFSPGIPSRDLRNRSNFFRICNRAGIIPPEEWEKLRHVCEGPPVDGGREFFECLAGVPIAPDRRGSPADVKLHYCDELWRKAKTVNRGRSVLGCILAHLIAIKTFVDDGNFDVLLEDNIRAPLDGQAAQRVRQTIEAARECEPLTGQVHMKYFGWLGSMLNLKWTFQSHLSARRLGSTIDNGASDDCFVAMFPTTQHVEKDLETGQYVVDNENLDTISLGDAKVHSKPGGTPVWGAYAYWISKEAYEGVVDLMRRDVGAFMWKPKSARFYSVKPIDKILPRNTFATFGEASVVITSRPAFFRAPMLASKIHSKFDPEFCKSTEYQLTQTDLAWSSLWLTDSERLVVQHHKNSGEWITASEVEENTAETF